MSKPKSPPPPDYAGAAAAQGAANVDAARASAKLSNPNVINPYGTQTVSYNGDVPTVTQKFAPGQQQIFDNEQQLQQQLGFLGIKAADLAGNTISAPLNFNERFGDQAKGRQEVIDSMMSRYDSDMGRQKDTINSDLIARGIPQGSKAYEVEMDRLSRGRNDALQQATIGADSRAMEERRQKITEALAERQVPLNEISAFRTGSQIQPLQFSGVQGQNVGAAPMFDAATQQGAFNQGAFGQQMGGYNNALTGLFGLGAAGAGAYGMMNAAPLLAASDRRLKSNIVRIGTHPLGIGIYEYDIFDRREVGVMADEVERVMPEAVVRHPSGYQMVDYALIANGRGSDSGASRGA